MSVFESHHPDFSAVMTDSDGYEIIARGFVVTEGLVWRSSDQTLIFSEIPSSTIYQWSRARGLSVLRHPSNLTNGNTLDRQGRLIFCEHATSCISRLEEDGRWITVLASHYGGKELNSPNDVVVDNQDRIWFTDPPYGRISERVGILREIPQDASGVYRLDPDGSVIRVVEDFDRPNGLCFSPDQRLLYICDTARMHIRRFRVTQGGMLEDGEVFAEISGDGEGKPDGLKADTEGRIYVTGPGGIHVYSPNGQLLGRILAPENTRNFCFGGEKFKELFLGTSSAILRLDVGVTGVAPSRCQAPQFTLNEVSSWGRDRPEGIPRAR